jgi:site-specific recombinase XerD
LPEPPPTERNGIKRLELLRDRALLLTLFCTGMRRDEVARLDRLDVEDGEADRALITGKGEKERVVFFDEKTQAAIRAYLQARNDTLAPLFLRHDNRRGKTAGHGGVHWRLGPQSVWATVKRYARELGVAATTHHFRHAKASVLLNRGASLSEVQDILGHASPDTTKRIYAHYQTQHLREAFDRYSASAEELVAELPGQRRTERS